MNLDIRKVSAVKTLQEVQRLLDYIFEQLRGTQRNIPLIDKNFVDATAAVVVFNLPPGRTVFTDYYIVKVDSSANAVTITPFGTDTIEGAATLSLAAQYDKALLTYSVGVWYRISP